jgi:hypothetical protein
MKWWAEYQGEVLDEVARRYWCMYKQLVDKAWTYKAGSKQFWAAEEQSTMLLNEWVEICLKQNRVIR